MNHPNINSESNCIYRDTEIKLFLLQDKNSKNVFFRFLKPSVTDISTAVQWTAVKSRAALFLDQSAAQEVADELYIAGHKEFEVVEWYYSQCV